jgi:hypothetical protein
MVSAYDAAGLVVLLEEQVRLRIGREFLGRRMRMSDSGG